MKPADKLTDTPAGAALGAEGAEVRKASIHAGLRAGGRCGKSAEKVRNLSLFSVLACQPNPAPGAAARTAFAARSAPSLVRACFPECGAKMAHAIPPTPGGGGFLWPAAPMLR